jgi:hypothetical protein
MVAGHLQEMGTNRIETMMPGKPCIGVKRLEQLEPFRWAMYHSGRDSMVERNHGIVRHAFKQLIKGQDLRPVGVLGVVRFVMNGSNRSLELVRANRPFCEGCGQEGDALRNLRLVP